VDFDWAETGKILSYLIPVVIFVIFNVFLRKQQEQKRRLEVVKSLIAEMDQNQKLMEAFLLQWQYKKFKMGNWKRHKDKLDYIDQGLRATLASSYGIAEGFNKEIELAKSRQGLEEWYALNKDRKKPPEDEGASPS